uniref:Basic helix-loop-helix transcription factor n=1 Tax=Salvia miltiorrhiza TaxID=226208 RepID=A0A0H3YB53_SALMI|nr:basic helix-loop-helix transcription factor [Salvia miltiorrhiza]
MERKKEELIWGTSQKGKRGTYFRDGGSGYLKTHDFLQPLERVGKHVTTTKEDIKAGVAAVDRPPAPAPPASVEHLLPGGIGTYSISYFNQLVLKPEGSLFTAQPTRNDENSNCSSYSGGSFTLWDESAVKKGKTGKENIATERHIQRGITFSSSQSVTFYSIFFSKDDDDDEEEEEFTIKKEPSPHSKGNLSVKVEAKTIDQKPNTPRSKHSATEQRRRSKINDRHRLREIIPNSEQKRDKASFLLEVIEYIQFLQEKVNRYDSSYNIWNHEPAKMMQWDSAPASVFGKKFDESKAAVSPSLPISGQNLVDSDLSTATTLRERVDTSIPASPISPKQASDLEKAMTWPPSQLRSCTTDTKMTEHELTIESGTINISSVYSQGLLNTLTQALQSSGVDLSQASISVQIDLGKKANGVTHSSTFISKEDEVDTTLPRSATASTGKEFGRAAKKLRTS